MQLSQEQLRQVTEQIQNGQKVVAIKLYREFTGVGLKEAVDAVDAITVGKALAPVGTQGRQLSGEQQRQVNEQLANGQKIEAIRLYREFTGLGLKEAKDAVEAMPTVSATVVPIPLKSSGSAGKIILAVIVVLIIGLIGLYFSGQLDELIR